MGRAISWQQGTELTALSSQDLAALRRAVQTLEHPGLAARLTNMMGTPIELVGRALPAFASEAIAGATSKGLEIALNVALRTMQRAPQAASHILHKTLATRPRPEPLGAHLVWPAWPSNCRSRQSLC